MPLIAEDTVHIVKKGDTLWDISRQYLESSWTWPIVWANNQDITNPHRIFPGDQVVISRKGDKTVITIIPAGQAELAVYLPEDIADVKDKGILISPQYSTYIYSPSVMTGSGTVIQKVGIGEMASKGESVLIKSKSGLVLRRGVTIVSRIADIKNGREITGYLYKAIAVAMVDDAQADVYKASIAFSTQEVRAGDLIFSDTGPIEPLKVSIFEPTLKESGRVIDLYGGVSGSSYLDLVFLNVGKADGVDQGAILNIHRETEVEGEQARLREYEGMVLVLQSLDTTCMALVTESKGPIQRGLLAVGIE